MILSPNVQKIVKKKKLNVKSLNLIMKHVYETNHDTDFKIETVDNFLLPFNEFYDISQDSFKDVVDKYVVNISLTDKVIKHIEYFTRAQQPSYLSWEYRKEKLTASNFYIAAVNKVEPSKKIKS